MKIPIDYDRRAARNPVSGRSVKVDGSMTYKDWIESLSTEERQALELAQKKDSRAVKNYVDKSGKSGIIKSEKTSGVFNSTADPLKEVFGSAETSNPAEVKEMIKHFNNLGVELIRSDSEKLCYAPGLKSGERGTVYISHGASYGAWLHEKKHVDDDCADGWLGMRVLENTEKCIKREVDAYEIEIEMAKKAGRDDIVQRLEVLLNDEIKRYE